MAAGQMTQQQLAAANAQARANILSVGVPRFQNIYSQSVTVSASGTPVNVNFQNVGLIRGFLVEVDAVLENTSTTVDATLTEFGAANILSNITLVDYNNITRINTTGFHMSMVNSAKQSEVFGGAYSPNVPVGFGNNWTVQSAATITHNGGGTATGALRYFYYVPCAYAKTDLRGAIYAGLVNATAYLALTVNPTPFQAAGDVLSAVYTATAGGYSGQVTITVYQDYIDQLPANSQGVILPPLDISTIYNILYTSVGAAITTNQDYGIPYANFRSFLSTMVIVDNGGTYNTGSDINYIMLQAANSTTFWKMTPQVAALFARTIFMADPPKGVYWFDSRDRPLNTQNYGNINLFFNMSTVNANPALLVGYEQFDLTQTIALASSLPTG